MRPATGSALLGLAVPLLTTLLLTTAVGAQTTDELVDELIATESPVGLSVAARFLTGRVEERHLVPLARKVLTVTGEGDAAAGARRAAGSLLQLIAAVNSPRTSQALCMTLAHPMPAVAGDAVRELLKREDASWHDHFLDTLRRTSLSEEHHLALLAPLTAANAPALCARLAGIREQLPGESVRGRVLALTLAGGAEQLTPQMLRQLMEDGSPEERSMAMGALAVRGDADAALALVGHLQAGDKPTPDLNAVAIAVTGLERLRVEHEQLLVALVERDLTPRAQTLILRRIPGFAEPRLLPRLWELAEAADDSLAAAACLAILDVAPAESIEEALATLQQHRLRAVRLEVAKRRLIRGDSAAVDILVRFLLDAEGPEVAKLLDEHRSRRTIPHLLDALGRASRDQRVGLRDLLQSHLKCFFPYRTPRLEELGLTSSAPDDLVAEILRVLRLWLDAKTVR